MDKNNNERNKFSVHDAEIIGKLVEWLIHNGYWSFSVNRRSIKAYRGSEECIMTEKITFYPDGSIEQSGHIEGKVYTNYKVSHLGAGDEYELKVTIQ